MNITMEKLKYTITPYIREIGVKMLDGWNIKRDVSAHPCPFSCLSKGTENGESLGENIIGTLYDNGLLKVYNSNGPILTYRLNSKGKKYFKPH